MEDKIRALAKYGFGVTKISKILGTYPSKVHRLMQANNIKPANPLDNIPTTKATINEHIPEKLIDSYIDFFRPAWKTLRKAHHSQRTLLNVTVGILKTKHNVYFKVFKTTHETMTNVVGLLELARKYFDLPKYLRMDKTHGFRVRKQLEARAKALKEEYGITLVVRNKTVESPFLSKVESIIAQLQNRIRYNKQLFRALNESQQLKLLHALIECQLYNDPSKLLQFNTVLQIPVIK